jgi:hypothetical protein
MKAASRPRYEGIGMATYRMVDHVRGGSLECPLLPQMWVRDRS